MRRHPLSNAAVASAALALAGLLAPAGAWAQATAFEDDFDCSDEPRFGASPGRWG